MKRFPIGIQTFRKIVAGEFIYVDKTQDIYRLMTEGGGYYLMSRPRRFGKSLLISTLAEIFKGRKELFEGLWIHDKIEWREHPVITIDFMSISSETPEALRTSLKQCVLDIAGEFDLSLDEERDYKQAFLELLKKLSSHGKTVILIDEYDKPIIDHIQRPDIAAENREILRTFYEVIKSSDNFLEFVFITGVSKFSKVSIFSGLNNLDDITLDERFSTMMGYTPAEMTRYFGTYLEGWDVSLEDVRKWYNGYSWDGRRFVYNPLSLMLFLSKKKFGNYWFSTGTPSFLLKLIRENKVDVQRFENYETNILLFDSFDVDRINLFSLLFQTGYLTIKEIRQVSPTRAVYRLSYPNAEVKESFLEYIAADYTGMFPNEMGSLVYALMEKIERDDIEGFIEVFKSLFASVPYDIFIREREAYYHTVIYLVLKLLGINISVEVETNQGRIDAVLETGHHIYVIEFKIGSASEAMAQIEARQYHQRFKTSGKAITLVGIGIDSELRNLADFETKSL